MATTTSCDKCGRVIAGPIFTLSIERKNQNASAPAYKTDRINDLCETCARLILEPYPREAISRGP